LPWIKPFVKEFFVFYSWILDWLPRSSWLSFQAFKVVELDKEVFKFGADLHVLDVFPSQSFGQNRLPFSINCVNCFFPCYLIHQLPFVSRSTFHLAILTSERFFPPEYFQSFFAAQPSITSQKNVRTKPVVWGALNKSCWVRLNLQ